MLFFIEQVAFDIMSRIKDRIFDKNVLIYNAELNKEVVTLHLKEMRHRGYISMENVKGYPRERVITWDGEIEISETGEEFYHEFNSRKNVIAVNVSNNDGLEAIVAVIENVNGFEERNN